MATFSNLRSSRLEKQSKSYVRPGQAQENHPDTSQLIEGKNTPYSDQTALYSLPSTLDVRPSENAGRGLFTKSHFRPGDVILSVKPSIAVLSTQYLANHCSTCFGPSTTSALKRCTTCRTVWYCNSICQNTDWALHKFECPALQRWSQSAPSPDLSIPNDAVRCLARLLWRKKRKGSDNAWAKQIDALQSHRGSLSASSSGLHANLSLSLVHYLGLSSSEEVVDFGFSSARDLLDVISRFVTNTFAVTSPSLTPIGVSVSPAVALINHSCDANAVVVFPRAATSSDNEPRMQVIALRPIQPNDEVKTSYIDATLPRALRQASLMETYNFHCRCTACAAPADADPRESVWCPKSCGGTCPILAEETALSRCIKCNAALKNSDAVQDAVRIGQEALDKATALEFKDPTKSEQLTTNLIPILISSGLTPSSHPLLALSRLHQSLLLSSLPSPPIQEALDETIRAASRSSTGLISLLTYGHPVRGIALAELGKLLAVDEPTPREHIAGAEATFSYPPSGPPRLKLAYETLVRARDELLIGFGRQNEGGQVGQGVRDDIVSLEKEIGVWKQGVRNVLEDSPDLSSLKWRGAG